MELSFRRCLTLDGWAVAGISLLAGFLLASSGCSGDKTDECRIQAIITMTDGRVVHFDEVCTKKRADLNDEISWELDARDLDVPIGLIISWRESDIPEPGSYVADTHENDLTVKIVRVNPTDPNVLHISRADEAVVDFTRVGYSSGNTIKGTFDNILLDRDEGNDVVHIHMTDGKFQFKVD